jgi:broad specificity phosphatase PhoE
MSVVLLVRHGQASWGAADYDVLSETGEQQARVLGAALADRGLRPAVVVRGAMKRHRQTAEQMVEAAGWDTCEVVEDAGWNEFDHQQMLALHPHDLDDGADMTREQFQRWFEAATLRWTSGDHAEEYDESFATFGARVADALDRAVEGLGPSDVAVVSTSGGPVSWAVASLLGDGAGPATDLWLRLNPVVVNSSVTKVVVGRRGTTLVSFNDHSHLEQPGLVTYR